MSSILRERAYFLDAPPVLDEKDHVVLTFNPILSTNKHMPFVPMIKSLLANIEREFDMPVDVEFAVNFEERDGEYVGVLYLVQVRPLGARPEHRKIKIPEVPEEKVVLRSGEVLGNGKQERIKYLVYVPINKYRFDRGFEIAREIGRINEKLLNGYILIGPGRWGTTHPDLGVPVKYSEISNAKVIVEMSGSNFTPEFSYGTHFFGDMVAAKILYIPLYPERGDYLNERLLERFPNEIASDIIKVIRFDKGFNVYVDGRSRMGIVAIR